MPKRKRHEEDNVAKKLRKIEKMLKQCKKHRRRIISSSSDSDGSSQSPHNPRGEETRSLSRDGMDTDSILVECEDQRQENMLPQSQPSSPAQRPPPSPRAKPSAASPSTNPPPPPPPPPGPSTSQEANAEAEDFMTQTIEDLPEDSGVDNEILEILGDDPTVTIEYGKDICPELATRFNHIATNGMNKDYRKELCDKYLIPGNCTLIGAPALNAEVKLALNENTLKRDKLIEARQKRTVVAISCLSEAISHALDAKEKDRPQIKRLMDTARLICDIQHNDSVSRRNLAVFSVNKEMKEPLLNTKIDKSLFGENLTESLRTAKAVTKSGSELKTQSKPPTKNWRIPVAGRRPPATSRRGGLAAPMTSAQPAAPPPPPPPAEQRSARGYSSRKPPPPPPRFARRRY